MSTSKLSRREFLKLSGTVAAGAVLASCAPKETPTAVPTTIPPTPKPGETMAPTAVPTAVPITGNVVFMANRGEWSEGAQQAFVDANPGITVDFIKWDQQTFFAMLAAGAQLDLLRTQAPIIPQLLARHLLKDLTSYFQASDMVKIDDLTDANKNYWANSPLEVGEGPIYGMCKDASPDMTVFINDARFEDAGVTPPGDTNPLTYQEVHELAKQVAVFDGDRVVTFGYDFGDGWQDRFWMVCLAETGKSLYKNGFSKVDFGDDTKALAKYYFDLANENLSTSPRNPNADYWPGPNFQKGIIALLQYGYWFTPGAGDDGVNAGKVRMLPAPTWAGVHHNATVTATGWVMLSQTQVPDAAWRLFEDYMGGQPAVDRAGSGWGVPALKSLLPLLPQTTPLQQQAYRVLNSELEVMSPLQFNPFLGEGSFYNAWNQHLEEALTGVITFDELCSKTEADVNGLIQEGVDRIGG